MTRVLGTNRTTTPLARNHCLANRGAARPPSEIHEGSLWVIERLRITRHDPRRDAQECRNGRPIGEYPSLNLANDNAEAHLVSWRREPCLHGCRPAVAVRVEIDDD